MEPVTTLVDGLIFPESPRWHEGKLWFVDMFAKQVLTVDLAGKQDLIAEFDDRPSGIGFLPDGAPIVVSMAKKIIVRLDTGRIHSDLSALGGEYLNDMVVTQVGRAYVSYSHRGPRELSNDDAIILVEPDGNHRIAARGGLCQRPNGLAITPDGGTLIAAMVPIRKLVAYTIDGDGGLASPRVFADLGAEWLDGICLDAEGAVWVGSPRTSHFLRIREGGMVTDLISVDGKWAVACMLGGSDRRTLFMATARVPSNPVGGMHGNLHQSQGFIEMVEVEVAGAGLP